jgi:D-beta-D-heptose 7-phosphate kinase / D-beta-D-heptose 1-phosphate adenosyltransferase
MPSAVEVVRRFRKLRALVIGDVMLDSYVEGTAARLCTEGPVPVVRKTAETHAPGGAANTAANVRALGAAVALLGVVGPDAAGARLRAVLQTHGVDDRWLVEDTAMRTLHKLRLLADGQYVVRLDDGEPCHTAASEQRLVDHLGRLYARCDLVLVSDYAYGVLSDGLLARLRALRASRPGVLVVDSKALRRFDGLGATVVTPNHREARLLVGVASPPADGGAPRDLAALERVGRHLLGLVDARYAAITLAGDGVLLLDRDDAALHLPAHPVQRAHDVGAGDSFAAALALALGAGARCTEAVRIGIEAAGVAVTRPRTAIVHQQELLQRVALGAAAVAPTVDALAARLAEERAAGRRIVFTNGVFDLLHAGHVEFLRQAKALGDVLVVGVNSDRGARRLKGNRRPINRERDRLALVAALDAVDHAVLFDEEHPAALIRTLRPHLHVKGGDYADEQLAEADAVREVGGEIVILPLVGGLSTTRVIQRIVALERERAPTPAGAGASHGGRR